MTHIYQALLKSFHELQKRVVRSIHIIMATY